MRVLLVLFVAAAFASGCASRSNLAESPPPPSAPPSPPPLKQPKYVSSRPLYINVVFGEKSAKNMLLAMDESKGDGTGYDIAYVDENMDGDLTNHSPKPFPVRQAPGNTQATPNVSFTAPCPYKNGASAEYSLDLYSLAGANSKTPVRENLYFFWRMTDADKWNFLFINGTFRVYPAAADALRGQPIRLAGKCNWSFIAKQDGENTTLSVGLKDPNGCTLRTVSSPNGNPTPTITLIDKAGKVLVKDQKMEFG